MDLVPYSHMPMLCTEHSSGMVLKPDPDATSECAPDHLDHWARAVCWDNLASSDPADCTLTDAGNGNGSLSSIASSSWFKVIIRLRAAII